MICNQIIVVTCDVMKCCRFTTAKQMSGSCSGPMVVDKRLNPISFLYKMMVIFICCSMLLMKSSARNSIHLTFPMKGTRRELCRRELYNIYIITFIKIRKSPLAIYTI